MAEIGNSLAVRTDQPTKSAGVHMLLQALVQHTPADDADEAYEMAQSLTNWELQEAMDIAANLEQRLAEVRRWVRARIADRVGAGNQLRMGRHLYRYSKTPNFRAREGAAATIFDIIAGDGRLGQWFGVNDALSSNTKVGKLGAAFAATASHLAMTDAEGRPVTEDGEPCVTEDGEWIEGREQGMYRDGRHWVEEHLVETVWPDQASLKVYTQGQRGWPQYADDLPDGEVVPVGKPAAD